MKVFLGGTCNESNWRNRIITMLEVGFFNPVVDDWTPDCMAEELRQREECDVCLYVITPRMTGVYSIAEVIDDSNKRPARTVFVRLRDDGDEKFTDGQWKSLGAVAQMVERNGGTAFDNLKSAALWINSKTPNAEECEQELALYKNWYKNIQVEHKQHTNEQIETLRFDNEHLQKDVAEKDLQIAALKDRLAKYGEQFAWIPIRTLEGKTR